MLAAKRCFMEKQVVIVKYPKTAANLAELKKFETEAKKHGFGVLAFGYDAHKGAAPELILTNNEV